MLKKKQHNVLHIIYAHDAICTMFAMNYVSHIMVRTIIHIGMLIKQLQNCCSVILDAGSAGRRLMNRRVYYGPRASTMPGTCSRGFHQT